MTYEVIPISSGLERVFITCVVDCSDLFYDALNKFNATRFKKSQEPILFVYNIGEPITSKDILSHANAKLIVFNNDEDLVTLKPYGKDYLTATTDAGIIAQQLAGVDTLEKNFRFFNFFHKPSKA